MKKMIHDTHPDLDTPVAFVRMQLSLVTWRYTFKSLELEYQKRTTSSHAHITKRLWDVRICKLPLFHNLVSGRFKSLEFVVF